MNYLQATLYGALQGITEFLPVSSSAHLRLLPWFSGWTDMGLSFDVALHMGTLAALILFFAAEWKGVLVGAVRSKDSLKHRRLIACVILATVPACVVGLLLKDLAETTFRAPPRVAACLAVFGLLLWAADRWGKKDLEWGALGYSAALAVGAAQALAVMPGVSRSGATITAGLLVGLSREDSARFSFYLAVPVLVGAGVLKLKDLTAADLTGPFLWAVLVSGVTGWVVLRFFLGTIRRSGLAPYAIYRLGLAVLILTLV